MQVLRPDDRCIDIDTRPDPTRTTPVVDLAPRIRRPASDIAHDLWDRSALLQIQWRKVRSWQSIEKPANKGRDILCVLWVTVVDIARRSREVVRPRQNHLAGRFKPRGAINVHGHSRGIRIVLVPCWTEAALDTSDGAIGVGDGVPEGAASAGEGVGSGFLG